MKLKGNYSMIQRFKNAIKAFKESDEVLTPSELYREKGIVFAAQPLGDGKAEFLGEGTEEEFIEQQREDKGEKPWYDRLKNLI